jgi:hypothetical protein
MHGPVGDLDQNRIPAIGPCDGEARHRGNGPATLLEQRLEEGVEARVQLRVAMLGGAAGVERDMQQRRGVARRTLGLRRRI